MIVLAIPILVLMALWAMFFLRRKNSLFGFQVLLMVGTILLPLVAASVAAIVGLFLEGPILGFMRDSFYSVLIAGWIVWPFTTGVILISSINDDEDFIKAVVFCLCLVGCLFMAALRGGVAVWVLGLPYLLVPAGSLFLWTYVPMLYCHWRGERKLPVNVVDTPNALQGDDGDGPHPEPITQAVEEDLSPIPLAGEE